MHTWFVWQGLWVILNYRLICRVSYYFRFKREMELEADHDIISDPYIKSVIKIRYKTFLSTNSCSKSCSVLQNINCARTQGFEIIKRFSISYSFLGLDQNGDFIKVFRVYSKLYQMNINSAVKRWPKLSKLGFYSGTQTRRMEYQFEHG